MKSARWLGLLVVAGVMYGQTWDSSGNSMLSGTYYFRQVAYFAADTSGDFGDAVTLYGNMTFDGKGNYSITAGGNNGGVVVVDAQQGAEALPATTGTYSISASGYGFIVSPIFGTDKVYGLVSANGVFVGSSTDNSNGYNDMMIAAQLASPAPTASSFTGSWTLADFDPNPAGSFSLTYMTSLMFSLNPDGNKNLNAGIISGYYGGSSQPVTQTVGGLTYGFSNGAAVATFPANGQLIYGQKYFYFSPDGTFMFGGGPATSTDPFDMIVGVKTGSSPALSGLYYQAGVEDNVAAGYPDSYFGALNVIEGAAPQTYFGHQRTNYLGGALNANYGGLTQDVTFTNTISVSGNVFTGPISRYAVGAGGAIEITSGISPYPGVSVALQAPPKLTGTGVVLYPTGVVNAASNAPFTARIAPGELLSLYGVNLADSTQFMQGGVPFPTSLGNVQVSIGGHLAPIYYVSPTQISAIVPYELEVGSIAEIEVTNDKGISNIVTQYVSATAPGVLTQNATGLGYGAIEHLGDGNSVAPAYSLVSDTNPAVEGETLAAYLTGLGTVSPAINDGALGAGNTTTNTIGVDLTGTAGTNGFSGLASGLAGLYQLNFTVPTGLTVGPNYLDVIGPDSYMSYELIPVQATPPATTASDTKAEDTLPARFRRPIPVAPAARIPSKKTFSLPVTGDQR